MEESTTTPVNNNEQKKPKKPSRFAFYFAVISLLGVIAVAGCLAFLWQNSIVKLQTKLQQVQQTQQANQRTLSSLQTTVQTLASPQAKIEHAQNEAEYLVQLADYNLHFQGDEELAIGLLKGADQQLSTIQDAAITPIRQTLANNIVALQAVPQLDLAGLVTRLNALSQQIPKLPVVPTAPTQNPAEKSKAPIASEPLWRRGLESVGNALKEVVVVRHVEHSTAAPLLPPQQQVYLVQNIQLQLAQAQWALLHRQPLIYQQSLQQASVWISQYFVGSAAITQSVLADLAQLQKIDVKPVLPDLSDTIKQIQNYNPMSPQQNPPQQAS